MVREQRSDHAILVINDSPEFLQLLDDFLGDQGYAVHCHDNGAGVLELAHTLAPNLIILDLVLGEVDGWAILTRLRADDVARHIPVVVCSAAVDRTRRYRDQLRDAAVRVLEKPFDLAHLLALVRELAGPPGGGRSRDAARQAAGPS
jgi:DNA-binding response OmpR family regulator